MGSDGGGMVAKLAPVRLQVDSLRFVQAAPSDMLLPRLKRGKGWKKASLMGWVSHA